MKAKALVSIIITIFVYGLSLHPFAKSVLAGGSLPGNAEAEVNYPTEYFDKPQASVSPNRQTGSSREINWPELLLGAFIGWILGLFSVLIVDYLKEPNLIFEVGSISSGDPINKWRFIHIKVKNLKRKIWFSPFTTLSAFSCKVVVKIENKSFVGRWTSKEQPIGNISDIINKALVHPREDIHPYTGEYEAVEVAVGIKYENEDEFYGFNNESYLPTHKDLKNMAYQFGKGEFDGEIVVSTLGKTYSQKFKVYNKSQRRRDFWLELISNI